MPKERTDSWVRAVAWIQGIYFALTGVWPLVDIKSFMAVTGPKTDIWLVRTVAVLVLAIGLSILVAGRTGRVHRETILLAILSAVGLAAIDVAYVAAGTIDKIYLLDAVAEVLLILGWAVACLRRNRPEGDHSQSN